MIKKLLFEPTSIPAVLKSLDAGMMRSKTIANNLANVTTPGYQRLEVEFEDELRKALDRNKLKGDKTHKNHLDIGRKSLTHVNPTMYHPDDAVAPTGINNVDVDIEAAKLAENQILFNYGVKFIRGKFTAIDSSIKGRAIQ